VKQISVPIGAILVVIVAVAVSATILPGATALATPVSHGIQPGDAPPAQCTASRSVQVSGSAAVNVVPDRASVQLGVQSNGVTVDEVEQANTAAIQRVLKALRAQGIEEKDLATDRYVIEPVYENYDALRIRGYRINNIVAVTLRDVNRTSPAIAAALRAGANQVVDVQFYTSQLRQYRDQARNLAMTAAGEKASALAEAAGAQAGNALTISENSWSYFNGMWGGQSNSLMTQNVVQNIAPASAGGSPKDDEPISLGQISIHAEVNVTYCLK
jgi:uncharacterized protein